MFLRCITLLLFCVLSLGQVMGQSKADNNLALEYFQKAEYDKAATLYRKLLDETGSKTYFDYLLRCFYQLQQWDDAEKVIKQQIRRNSAAPSYRVELGVLYRKQNNDKKADKTYDDLLDDIKNEDLILPVADAFISHQEWKWAEETYRRGQSINPQYGYHVELATLFSLQRNYPKMVDEYMALLSMNEAFIEQVQTRLQNLIANDDDNSIKDLLRGALLKKLQSNADDAVANELLLWLSIQEHNYSSALVQSRALDRRRKEDGQRIYSLARLAVAEQQWDIAIQAYQYLIDKGNSFPYFRMAQFDILSCTKSKLLSVPVPSITDLQLLAQRYQQTLTTYNLNVETLPLARDFSELNAYWLHQSDTAINLLTQSAALPALSATDRGLCNMLLADIYLFADNPWDAALLYARVEQQNADNPLGNEAKFKRARLAYYQGNFRWAQALLDVLKASTEKLIAKDAFELSEFIQSNIDDDDSVGEALQLFARADLRIFQKQDSLALLILDSLATKFKTTELLDDILYKKASVYTQQNKFDLAADAYQKVVDQYGTDILADNALFQLASLYETRLQNPEKAAECYKKIITSMQNSIYITEARRRYRILEVKK